MSEEKFKDLLDKSYTWPDYYEFKFIVKISAREEVLAKLPDFRISENQSKNGNYVSISARKLMSSADEVMETYSSLSKVEGIISL